MKKYLIEPGKDSINVVEINDLVVGHNDVKVRVKAVSLNYRDILTREYTRNVVVPFSDGAGEVIEVGSNVTDFKVGDRVVGLFFPTWMDGSITPEIHELGRGAGMSDGMLSQLVVGDQDSFMKFPEYLSYEQASTLPCAGLTAWHALFEHERPTQAGQTVLIQGTGGVSIYALQLAVAFGLETIVLSSSDEKLKRVKAMGASHTINYKTHPDWDKEVLKLTANKGVDIVLEVGGAGTLEKSMNAVKMSGVISLIGVLSGINGTVIPFPIVVKSLRVFGIYVGSKAMQMRFHDALVQHAITPVIDSVFDFDDASKAYDYQKSGKHFGKVVVSCDSL